MPVISGRTREERRGRSCVRDRRTETSISRGNEERMFQAELYFSRQPQRHIKSLSPVSATLQLNYLSRVYITTFRGSHSFSTHAPCIRVPKCSALVHMHRVSAFRNVQQGLAVTGGPVTARPSRSRQRRNVDSRKLH